jgi:CheY-like chemotaxis protein
MTNFLYKGIAHPAGSPLAQRSHAAAAAPLVLIVEDDEDIRFMLCTLLEMRGIRVAQAADGEAGARAAEEQRPDLILMDGSLPRLDGLAATRRIREREGRRKVPIVFVSGHAAPASQAEAFAAGCDAYLIKPIDFDKLNGILEYCLRLNESLNCETT